ncbi:serine/threonine-protein kinase [Nocardia caishijiensis]|uniref:non-specific serine/threonine protein kinase n=1 Tax=Nocardia caishijiensis TaxID=184756 RepID=A0ABQ6YUT4_9NOCA|nr:serine/threonine-protein kinase [Nocardia caishijiensis]KAF0849196.1 serine/threonine-protein kinase [Nocardia caishijiensis]
MTLYPGSVIGGYQITRQLGHGGMGTVYLAKHPSLPRYDAVKVLKSEFSSDTEFRARFEREAEFIAGLDHPNIVTVHSRGEQRGLLWIAMQYVDGSDAAAELERGAMSTDRALHIATQMGTALDHAHGAGLLHRDVKPANFLLGRTDTAHPRALLTDFGVAKLMENDRSLTETGTFVATLAYASPEQLLLDRLDGRSDLYSLGCSLYKMLTGANPFPAATPAGVLLGHLHEPPPKVTALRPELPSHLDAVFATVLAKDRDDRYPTCLHFIDDVTTVLSGGAPSVTCTIGPYFRESTNAGEVDAVRRSAVTSRARSARRRLVATVCAAALIVVAVATSVWTREPGQAATASPPATTSMADVRQAHPQFAGKSVAVYNYGDTELSAVLEPSDQAQFLRELGFVIPAEYNARSDESSPRKLDRYNSFQGTVDLMIVLRTDSAAGNGGLRGLRGLPSGYESGSARIAVIDDPAVVQAFQNWTDSSDRIAIESVVPRLAAAL